MERIGKTTARKMKRPVLTFGLRSGYEMLRSSTEKGWKSGLTVDKASAMPAAALVGLLFASPALQNCAVHTI